MLDLEKIYGKLPDVLQQLACSLEGGRVKRQRYNRSFFEVLTAVEARSRWNAAQLAVFRDARLASFVAHCERTVPYYRRKFKEWGIRAADIRTLEDMAKIPVLTRDEVKTHLTELVSAAVSPGELFPIHTGDTTGAALRFVTTRTALREQWAVTWRHWRSHGVDLNTWCGNFAGRSVVPSSRKRPPFWRYNLPMRQILFSGYHMSPANLPFYVAELRRRKPPWLYGYPSLMALLAGYIIESGDRLDYPVKWVGVGSENLTLHQAELIRRAFGVAPFQHYGMSEAVAQFSECEQGRLHIDEDFAGVRFVPGENGHNFRIVGTNFTNLATPLLNYDVHDAATLAGGCCSCGRPGRIVQSVDGRLEDYVILRNGARVGGIVHLFKHMDNIREAQICQRVPGEIVVRVVRGRSYLPGDEGCLMQELRSKLGADTAITIEYAENLHRAHGKLRFVVSEVGH